MDDILASSVLSSLFFYLYFLIDFKDFENELININFTQRAKTDFIYFYWFYITYRDIIKY